MWASHPVVIAGSSADWHENLSNYNTGTKLAFAFANNDPLVIELKRVPAPHKHHKKIAKRWYLQEVLLSSMKVQP